MVHVLDTSLRRYRRYRRAVRAVPRGRLRSR